MEELDRWLGRGKGPLQGMEIRHRDIIKAPVAGRKTKRRICKIEQEEICQR
jgi:hypothetical protein